MNNNLIIRIFISVFLLFITVVLQAKTIYYVTANGTGDGSSWSNAANSIQTMIDKAVSKDEVWVAKGTYYPTTETIPRDARSKTFLLKNGVSLYGGFGGNETNILQRVLADLDNNGRIDSSELVSKTILNGDIDGVQDVWSKTINSDGKTWIWSITGNNGNCYQVVKCPYDFSSKTYFNGFSIVGGNANSSTNSVTDGGGIYAMFGLCITNCEINYCNAIGNGGGIYAIGIGGNNITNCNIYNCNSASGGGIYSYKPNNSSATPFSSNITQCMINNCSASINGGGIYNYLGYIGGSTFSSYITNCLVTNCSANTNGGGIYGYAYGQMSSSSSSCYSNIYISNCFISNCSSFTGGGIYGCGNGVYSGRDSGTGKFNYGYGYCYLTNCMVSNCSATSIGGGIYKYAYSLSGGNGYSFVTNCTAVNCTASTDGGGIYYNATTSALGDARINMSNCSASNNYVGTLVSNFKNGPNSINISPDINIAYVKPTSFIGIASSEAQRTELAIANWHLKEGSPNINSGTSTNVTTDILIGNDVDGKTRVQLGIIDIGIYEYGIPVLQMPIIENFNNWTNFDKSDVFYNSASVNSNQNINWSIANQKINFSWQTNLTTTYSHPIFTYQIDGTKKNKVFLRYDMYFQAYAGTISPLGTERLNVEFSSDLITWSNIATHSNLNGTLANQTYKCDISTFAAGKTFFIRFNANGANSNRIEKWEIDNVIIDADGLSAVEITKDDKLLYSISDSRLTLRNIEQGSYVQLFDINGKLIESAKANSNTLEFILPIHGVYILKASSESGIYSRKVVL